MSALPPVPKIIKHIYADFRETRVWPVLRYANGTPRSLSCRVPRTLAIPPADITLRGFSAVLQLQTNAHADFNGAVVLCVRAELPWHGHHHGQGQQRRSERLSLLHAADTAHGGSSARYCPFNFLITVLQLRCRFWIHTRPDRAPRFRLDAGKTSLVRFLLDNGADVNMVSTRQKETALSLGVLGGNPHVVHVLCERGKMHAFRHLQQTRIWGDF
jgi:hypothetical protein